jgi:3-mercaptopyruvate sulfurtransferase SseA
LNVNDDCVRTGFRADLHRWRQLVSPAWLAGLLAQTPVVAAPAGDWRLFEIGYGLFDAFLDSHIGGAAYIDTLEFESAPLWNKVSDAALLQLLLKHGIRHDTTVILYGRNCLAAARAAHLMLYAGVADVRLLDGGFDAWCDQALPIGQGPARQYPVASNFGVHMPAHPEYLIDMHQTRQLIEQDGVLISVRTWNEFIGKTSGYSYIEAKGEIPGARWGRTHGDNDVNSMSEFHGPDGTMISSAEICSIWGAINPRPGKQTAFYCGTGWRASLAFFYAWLMNWERISVYDGGWCEWSRDPDNPVVARGG